MQQQGLDHGDMRLVEKVGDPHFFVVHRVFERAGGVGHLGGEYVGDIKLPGPPQHLCGRVERALARQPPAIDQGGCEAGNEDEHLGRVVETERLQGEIAQHILRNVIDKDQDQRHAAEKIETEIALRGRLGQGR